MCETWSSKPAFLFYTLLGYACLMMIHHVGQSDVKWQAGPQVSACYFSLLFTRLFENLLKVIDAL